jgi:ATP-binding cassette subfamily B protein
VVNEAFYKSRASIYKSEAWYFTGLSKFFTQLITVAVVVFGGLWLSGVSLDISDFISFLLYVNYLTAPIPELVRITTFYQEGLAGFNRFMEIMEIPGEKTAAGSGPGEKVAADMGPGVSGPDTPGTDTPDTDGAARRGTISELVKGNVEFRNVSFRYGDEGDYILRDISLDVRAGEYIALTGPSGIGKSTFSALLPRFYEVSSGAILIDGTDTREMELDFLRRNIGIVQQEIYLFSGTPADNIAYGKPGASREEIIEAAQKADAHDFIMALPGGYDAQVGQRGVLLSGGQRQRLCIARLFLKDPPILIFDEATSALDYESERVIHESLKVLSRNRTAFVITHRLSSISAADRVLVLSEEGIREERH